ncbi:hypothetical protein ElyMa_006708500 [Elysia marginata]|uniref:Peptidase M13 N-terminal domain-containing protein n=1 Tax=Elysia marginata TaxID=1093978 RepID=A0AAV4IU22_9GAST|nr:hypothetical protein ElyMa_006708500 [Elysia marginata]
MKNFKAAVAKESVQKKFKNTSKACVNDMFDRVKKAYSSALDEWDWMSEALKRTACEKMDQLMTMLSYRGLDLTNEVIEDVLTYLPQDVTGYLRTRQGLHKWHKAEWFKNLNKVFDLAFLRDVSLIDYQVSYKLDNNLTVRAAYMPKERLSLKYTAAYNFASLGISWLIISLRRLIVMEKTLALATSCRHGGRNTKSLLTNRRANVSSRSTPTS